MVSDWLFRPLCQPQTMESSVFPKKNQWFAPRDAGHTSPKSATWAGFVGSLALQIGVKSYHLAAAWAFKIAATAMRAEQVALFWGQSGPTSTCLVNFCWCSVYSIICWVAGGKCATQMCKRIRGERYLCTHQMTLPYLTLPLPYLTLPYLTLPLSLIHI